VAGFCDTSTFVSGDSIFSAHVTGNFIVFAAQLIVGREENAWIKLLTFPVFTLAIIAGGWLAKRSSNKYQLLLIESILLLLCGIMAVIHSILSGPVNGPTTYCMVMIVVAAMGLQNAFGKLYAKETHGPTTMMTGNVTQAALDMGSLIGKSAGMEAKMSLRKQLYLIGGFLLGCLMGAVISKIVGLISIAVPAVMLIIYYRIMRQNHPAGNK